MDACLISARYYVKRYQPSGKRKWVVHDAFHRGDRVSLVRPYHSVPACIISKSLLSSLLERGYMKVYNKQEPTIG